MKKQFFFKVLLAAVLLAFPAVLICAQDNNAPTSSTTPGGGYATETPIANPPTYATETPIVTPGQPIPAPMPPIKPPIIIRPVPVPMPPVKDNPTIAQIWMSKIDQMYKEKKFQAAIVETASFNSWLDKTKDQALSKQYKPLVYDVNGKSHESVGEYLKAAETYKQAYAFDNQDKWAIARVNCEKEHQEQAKYFQDANSYWKEAQSNATKLANNGQKKLDTVTKFFEAHKITPPTKDQMVAFRKELKVLTDDRTKILNTMNTNRENFQKIANAAAKADIFFNHDQNVILAEHSAAVDANRTKSDNLTRQANQGVLKVAEEYKKTWPGLQEAVNQLTKIMDNLSKLQDDFIALASKSPLSDAEKVQLREMKQKIASLTSQMDKVLDSLVEAFMNSDVFDSLTPAQQNQLMNSIVAFYDKKAAIDTKNDQIAQLWIAIKPEKLIGDLNGDGVIDKNDLAVLHNLMGRFPIKEGEAGFHKGYDFDGDGVITMTDYYLLAQAVNGTRKYFPVDPQCQKGDMNGDGAVDQKDLQSISNCVIRGINVKSAYGKVCDFNGDGKVSVEDVITMAKVINIHPMPMDDKTAVIINQGVDVNGDGKIDYKDLLQVMQLAFNPAEIVSPEIRKAADINGDGKIDVNDIIALATNLPDGNPPVIVPLHSGVATASTAVMTGTTVVPASDTSSLGSGPQNLAPVNTSPSSDDLMGK
ncbi:MAG: hypothetical protein HQM08_12000 [Candidatus Riflebacteria bacterium]|nr:hypothetical protein [Candidatus Riflebacteria bacterium]